MMRRRGPSLLGVVAVSAATSHVVAGNQQKQAQQQQAAQQQAYDQGAAAAQQQAAMAAPPPPAALPAPAEPDMNAQLEQLAQLKAAGIITEDEFTAKKKLILGI